MAELIRGELNFWKKKASGELYQRRVRSIEEALLLAQTLQEYEGETAAPDGIGLQILEEGNKSENGVLGWKEWKDERGRSFHTVLKEEGIVDLHYLVEIGNPNGYHVSGTQTLYRFSQVVRQVLLPDSNILNVYRGSLAVPAKQIFGRAGWRLDFMTKWEVEWFAVVTMALESE